MKPLRLKNFTLASGVLQSPMAACTDLAFRLVAREKGLEFAFLEMVCARALVRGNAKTLSLLKSVPEDKPLGAQVVGGDPGVMAEAAAILEEMGFDLLDINLGCPVPKITGGDHGSGSALLRDPDRAEEIFKAVVKAVRRIPVTVKMRSGYSDPSGAEAVEIAKRAESAGVLAVTVHGRTRAQRYAGRADYQAIARVKSAVALPVIGNGDVRSACDAQRMLEASGCDAVMIGRGGLGNPWLYRGIFSSTPYVPSAQERIETLLRHMDLEVLHEGERDAVMKMRRIGCWYTSGLRGCAEFRFNLCGAKSIPEMRGLIEDFGSAQQGGHLPVTGGEAGA